MARRPNIDTIPPEDRTIQDRIRAWIEENPFRKWRRENGINRTQAMVLTKASQTTIPNWETGATRPNDENMMKLAGIMGVATLDLHREWDKWLADAPQSE